MSAANETSGQNRDPYHERHVIATLPTESLEPGVHQGGYERENGDAAQREQAKIDPLQGVR
jgi:hypothetical protein